MERRWKELGLEVENLSERKDGKNVLLISPLYGYLLTHDSKICIDSLHCVCGNIHSPSIIYQLKHCITFGCCKIYIYCRFDPLAL